MKDVDARGVKTILIFGIEMSNYYKYNTVNSYGGAELKKGMFLISALILISLVMAGCGIPQSQLDAAIAEKNVLQGQLDEITAVYPLKGFDTLSEFKDWVMEHVQPETTYGEDAFLAAYKVQQAGMSDGYLMGIDIDTYEDSEEISVYISTFVGNELYWWFVESAEEYGSYELSR